VGADTVCSLSLPLLGLVRISFAISLNSRPAPDDYGFAMRPQIPVEINRNDSENKATNATGNRRLDTKPRMTIKIIAPTGAGVA